MRKLTGRLVSQLLYFWGKAHLVVTEQEFGWVSGGALVLLEKRKRCARNILKHSVMYVSTTILLYETTCFEFLNGHIQAF